jgi:hypothetical protein
MAQPRSHLYSSPQPYFQGSTDVRLDASQSYDPDQCMGSAAKAGTCVSTGLAFTWECATSSGDRCRSKEPGHAPVSFAGASSLLSLNLTALSLDGETYLTMTVTVKEGSRVATALARISLTPAQVDPVLVTQKIYSATRVAFQGSVAAGGTWTISGELTPTIARIVVICSLFALNHKCT